MFYFQTEKLLMINLHAVDFKDKKFENLPVKTVILTCDSNDKYEAVSYLSGNENGFTVCGKNIYLQHPPPLTCCYKKIQMTNLLNLEIIFYQIETIFRLNIRNSSDHLPVKAKIDLDTIYSP